MSSYTYTVNPITQRESVTTAGAAFAGTQADWVWQYDPLGQIISAHHASTAASDRAYQYDSIGNRVKTASGTLTLPNPPNWVSNALNQYTTADGVALPITPTPAPFDLDGNMTAGPIPGSNGNNPGVQAPANATAMKWDAENRLVSLTIGSTTYNYDYDHLSRLITCSTDNTVNARFAYDGWNRIAEYDNTTLQDTFTWGLDLSGNMQGAGGVGGLLATRWVSASNTDYFLTYDGNGNVSEYLGTNGSNEVHYEYDPFGTLTRRTGSTSTRFQYRFSTKPRDINTGLYYYGYRYYDPLTGRWQSRDSIAENGGLNLHGFIKNNAIFTVDVKGRRPFDNGDTRKAADMACKTLMTYYNRNNFYRMPSGMPSSGTVANMACGQIASLGYYCPMKEAGYNAKNRAKTLMELHYSQIQSACKYLTYPDPQPSAEPKPKRKSIFDIESIWCRYDCNLLKMDPDKSTGVRCMYDCKLEAGGDTRCGLEINPFRTAAKLDSAGCLFCADSVSKSDVVRIE